MLWATVDNEKKQAFPGAIGTCPCCGQRVIPKCGKLVTWHWAHKQRDCDPWYEPESAWHIAWKSRFPKEWQEVTVGDHRADVRTPLGVIEFQNSSLTAEAIYEREKFYGKMIWVVNAKEFADNLFLHVPSSWPTDYARETKTPKWQNEFVHGRGNLFDLMCSKDEADRTALEEKARKRHEKYLTWLEQRMRFSRHFRWQWPRKTWLAANKKVYLDLGDESLYLINGVYGKKRTYIKTRPISKEYFMCQLLR